MRRRICPSHESTCPEDLPQRHRVHREREMREAEEVEEAKEVEEIEDKTASTFAGAVRYGLFAAETRTAQRSSKAHIVVNLGSETMR